VRTMSAAIAADAPPMAVWAVLTDLASYPEWNPLFPAAAGEIAVGATIRLTSTQPCRRGAMIVKAAIVVADPGSELRWAAGLKGIIGGEHRFLLTRAGNGTRLVQSETFGGLLVPISGRVLAGAEASFRPLNEALRKRAAAA
jgi:hypothetical protein